MVVRNFMEQVNRYLLKKGDCFYLNVIRGGVLYKYVFNNFRFKYNDCVVLIFWKVQVLKGCEIEW